MVGTWNTAAGASGTVTGLVKDGALRHFVRDKSVRVKGRSRAATVESDGSVLRGSYQGQDCNGTITAVFVVKRRR